MSFIAKNVLNDDERLMYVARIHWIYLLVGGFWYLLCASLGYFLESYIWTQRLKIMIDGNPVLYEAAQVLLDYPLPFVVFSLFGAGIFCVYGVKVISSEIALTDKRIIYKHGLFNVNVEELDFSEIRGEHVHHGFIGSIFGCGSIHLDARLVGDVYLPYISKPHKFLSVIHRHRL